MSTETTNKKIKIDNGTTFGRTYTDKAVDELLKNAGGGGTSVIELIDKNGTIASAQLSEINAKPQNFAFKYSGKILLFTGASSTTYQYCNNTTNSSDNNVMTTSTLLTIESSTGVYTIAENVHNVVANSIHPVNGGDLTNIQVGSKVYSIPGGGKPLLDLLPYYNIDTSIVSQEGMSLLTNKVLNNEIVGISLGSEFSCMLLDGIYGATIDFLSRVIGEYGRRVKVSIAMEDGKVSQKDEYASLTLPSTSPTSQLIPSITTTNTQQNLTIGNGLAIENGVLKATGGGGSSSKVWYELPSLFFLENITQEQFDAIKNLVLQNQLAGINCTGLYCPLTFYNDGQNITFFHPWYENDIFTAYIVRLNADLSVKKIPYSTITLPQTAPTSQLIPSITTTNKQQNLTIGNGLEIKNGALQATGSSSRVFEPTINNVSIMINDETKLLTFNFNVSNFEIITYLTTLIKNNKSFTETLYLKTPTYESYQMMFNTPLSLVNASTNVSDTYHCFFVIQNVAVNIKGVVKYGENNMELDLIFSDDAAYTGYKQLANALFTNDTKIKITIKTDE